MDQQVEIHGTVAWFATEKGFGFLKRDDELPDVFVHYTAIQSIGFKTLTQGQRVKFMVEQGRQGLQASHVKVI